MNFKKMTAIDIWELKDAFRETYGYDIDNIHELLFGDSFSNDSYKTLYLNYIEEDADYEDEDTLKIVKMLRDKGFNENEILIDITW